MVSKLRLVFTTTIVFLSFYGYGQNTFWRQETSQNEVDRVFSEQYDIDKGKVFAFEEADFKRSLQTMSFAKGNSKVVYFPDEHGKMVPFQVSEAPVMSPELSAKYPQIKSYAGHALDATKNRIRFSVSQNGIQSMVVASDGHGTTFMQKDPKGKYVLYTRDKNSESHSDFICSTKSTMEGRMEPTALKRPVADQVLRRYRLAVAASGTYTDFHGGTVADALAAINATVTRINEVFETDLGITLELVPQTDQVIFTNAATDPFTTTLSAQTQATLTSTIGATNYDIGILFDKIDSGGDGNAGFIGSVCIDNRKGSAYASYQSPAGDIFDLDFVAHEMGHQFGANHTWSFEDEGTDVQVEPGSGTTIMGYAGIVGNNNVAPSGDDYFHYVSIEQISEYIATTTCAVELGLTNNPPLITPLGNFTIPRSTAFVLTGTATDVDATDVLTYVWEQIDDGIVSQATFGPANRDGAKFRSLKPSTDPVRYFPKLSSVLTGALTQVNPAINSPWETVSEVQREMNFAFTVRDNALGGGQVVSDLVNVMVTANAGPFEVTSQTSPAALMAGSVETIAWDVADTDKAPINAQLVDILLSIDGGLTFPIILAAGTPNDGSHDVLIPSNQTNNARIMVKASDHIFLAVNSAFFSIAESEIVLNFAALNYEVCQPNALVVPFLYQTYLGFSEEVTFSVINPPAGLDVLFSPLTATTDGTPVQLTLSNTQNVALGSYPIRIAAISASVTRELTINVNITDTGFTEVALVAPENGLADVSTKVFLEWEAQLNATSYDVQVATDAAFANVIESANTSATSYKPSNLENDGTYFWRVEPKNLCGQGTWSQPFSFTTIEISCATKEALGLPATISPVGTPTIISKISFFDDMPVSDIKVSLRLDHLFLSDLNVTLTSPSGTSVVLLANSCGELRNINAVFDDSAPRFECEGTPAIKGIVRPLGFLNSFRGESLRGEWILTVRDLSPSDGGSLIRFAIEACVEGRLRPDDDNDGVFDDGDDLCLGTPLGAPVDITGCPIFLFPSTNFELALQSESCRNSNDGALTITATLPLDYTVNIVGNGTNNSGSFSDSFTSTGLMAGTYTVCINGTDGTVDYEEYCFVVVITEPEALGVSSKISLRGRLVELQLSGASRYNIELNGILVQTEASDISLNLMEGGNTLKVYTNLACQGSYEEQFFISDKPIVYPNPTANVIKIGFATSIPSVKITVFSADGRLVRSGIHEVNGMEVELDLSNLSEGLYYLMMEGENFKSTSKIVKR